jgi:DNA-binding CsgD family transcriptional regulator
VRVPEASGGMVGRDRERERLAAFLGAGWPRVLLVEGPPGIGKTTLLEAALVEARGAGIQGLVARAVPAEADLPYAILSELLPDPTVDRLARVLAEPRRLALDRALRRGGHVAGGPDAGSTGAPLDAAAVGLALLDLLRSLARSAPVLVAVDDLQWCDEASAAALAYALRRAQGIPVAAIAARRTTVDAPSVAILRSALGEPGTDVIEVGPLSVGAIGRILDGRLGRQHGRSEVTRVVEAAAGNPLFAIEIARAVDVAREGTGTLAVPPSAEPLLADRLGRLSAGAVDVVLVVAATARADVSTVAVALGSEAAGAPLAEALRSGLVRSDAGRIGLEHPLVGSAALGRALPSRVREIHGRLAAATADPEERARHRALSADGPDPVIAAELDAAAESAAERGASGVAAESVELALALTPAPYPDARAARHLRAAGLRLASGDPKRAAAHVATGLDLLPPGPARVPLRVIAVEIACASAGRPAARAEAEIAITEAAGDPLASALAHAALLAWGVEDAAEARRHAETVLSLLAGREDEAPFAAGDALALLADARLAAGEGPAVDLLEHALAIERRAPGFVIGSLEILAGTLRTADRVDEAREAYAEVLARLAAAGVETRRVAALAHAAWTEILAGRYDDADRFLADSLRLAEELRVDASGAHVYLAHLDGLRGRADVAAMRRRRAEAMTAGDDWMAALWSRALAAHSLAAGDAVHAAELLRSASHTWISLGILEPNYMRIDADLVEALVAAGRHDEATGALASFEERSARSRLPWSVVAAARARAALLDATGDPTGALAVLDDAAEMTATLPLPLERGRIALVQGGILRRLRRVREARGALEEARAAFAALPSPPWEARAAAELARLGGRAATADALTPAERQVAELAAAGRSNREIAAVLVLSVRTVESQLSSAYAKLGVRGRAGLGAALAGDGGAKVGG